MAGQTLTFDAVNVPVGSVIGVQLIDLAPSRPGITFPGIIAPGCRDALTFNALFYEVTLFPPSTVTGTVPLVIPAGVEGAEVFAQYAILDGLVGGPDLVSAMSNAVKVRVGVN